MRVCSMDEFTGRVFSRFLTVDLAGHIQFPCRTRIAGDAALCTTGFLPPPVPLVSKNTLFSYLFVVVVFRVRDGNLRTHSYY